MHMESHESFDLAWYWGNIGYRLILIWEVVSALLFYPLLTIIEPNHHSVNNSSGVMLVQDFLHKLCVVHHLHFSLLSTLKRYSDSWSRAEIAITFNNQQCFDSSVNRLIYKIVKNVHDTFADSTETYLNALFCLTNNLKPEDIHFIILID